MNIRKTSVTIMILSGLAFSGPVWAAYVAPSDWTPYEPANNQCTVQFIKNTTVTFSGRKITLWKYSCPNGNSGSMGLDQSVPKSKVQAAASFSHAFKKFYRKYGTWSLIKQGGIPANEAMVNSMAALEDFFRVIDPLYNR